MVVSGENKNKRMVVYICLTLGAIFVLFPFFWMILTAFRNPGTEFSAFSFKDLTISNFYSILVPKNANDPNFFSYFLNSLIVAFGVAFLTTVMCALGGYVFAKKEFWGKDLIQKIFLATWMIPGMMFMVPQFAIVNKFGWMNTYKAMIIPHLASVFGLFLMIQFIKTIPTSLIESAKIDGASEFQVFYMVILPLSASVVTTLFLLTFLGQWSNFLWQLIVTTEPNMYTLPVGLAMFKGQYGTDWTRMMAAASVSIIPIAILFLAAQQFFIEGMTAGAVKE